MLSEELLDDEDDHPEICLRCLRSLAKWRPLRPVQGGTTVYPAPNLPPEFEALIFGQSSSRRKGPAHWGVPRQKRSLVRHLVSLIVPPAVFRRDASQVVAPRICKA